MPLGHLPENLSGWSLKIVFASYASLLGSRFTELLMLPFQKGNSLSIILVIILFLSLSFVLDTVSYLKTVNLITSGLDFKNF